MAETWTISVGGRVYGPYTIEQMQAFRAENRLADHSLVARDDEEHFHPAGEDPVLASLFHADQPREAENAPASEPAEPHRFGARTERYGAMEVGFAAENLYLEAAALGLGTTFMGNYNDSALSRVLGPGERPMGVMPVGRPR